MLEREITLPVAIIMLIALVGGLMAITEEYEPSIDNCREDGKAFNSYYLECVSQEKLETVENATLEMISNNDKPSADYIAAKKDLNSNNIVGLSESSNKYSCYENNIAFATYEHICVKQGEAPR